MKSYPGPEAVAEDLGEKVVTGFVEAVSRTRKDLQTYRETLPGMAVTSTRRGLANWIHDRLWYHLDALVGDLPTVELVDKEPLRLMRVGTRYLFRVKRHTEMGLIKTYPTQEALSFFEQGPVQDPFEGMDELRLSMGYVWDPEARSIGAAVICLHSEMNQPVWVHELDELLGASRAATPMPPRDEPDLPAIDVPSPEHDEGSGTDSR